VGRQVGDVLVAVDLRDLDQVFDGLTQGPAFALEVQFPESMYVSASAPSDNRRNGFLMKAMPHPFCAAHSRHHEFKGIADVANGLPKHAIIIHFIIR